MGLIQEFKTFAMRGNVVDMAVGIIIGGAFGKIVSSLVNDVVMPAVGGLAGMKNFADYYVWLGQGPKPETLEAARAMGEPFIGWGSFVQSSVDFFILALVIFLMVKLINQARRRFDEAPQTAPPAPPEDIVLLRQIRDALQKS